MKYYLLPHPFKQNENVIFGDLKIDKRVWEDFNNPKSNIPIVKREIIVAKNYARSTEDLESLVKDYENSLNKKQADLISRAKFNAYSDLGIGLSASYLLYYCIPEPAMNLINNFLQVIGDPYVGTMAKISLCAIPAVFSIVKNVGIPFGDVLGIGRKRSKIYKLNELEKPYKEKKRLINLFGLDIKEKLVKDISDLAGQFKGTETKKELLNLNSGYAFSDSHLNKVIETAEKENLPYGKIQQLIDMKEDITAHRENNFKFAPLKVVYSGKQADNLESFLNKSKKLREKIIIEYKTITNTNTITNITNDLEKLFGMVSRYDFGDTNNINDRGFLKEFYYGLYILMGSENEKILKKGKK